MKKYIAEFLGTFLLTFICCGAASYTGGYKGFLGVVGIALIFGLTLTALCYTVGEISGSHVNPAVSVAMYVTGRMSVTDFAGYVIAQFLGGIAAGFALFGLTLTFNQETVTSYATYGYNLQGLGTNGYGDAASFVGINAIGAAIVEIILTFIFVWVVLSVTAKKELANIAGLIIGGTLTAVHIFGICITGTSVNPARSFGPALAAFVCGKDSSALGQGWLFVLAPLVGGILAAFVYVLLQAPKKAVVKEELEEEA